MTKATCMAFALIAAFATVHAAPARAALGDCGQPQSTGDSPKTGDALAALRSAVGSASSCDDEPCICDVNSSGEINTSDALQILRAAVGQSVTLDCDCECTVLAGPDLDAPASPRGGLGLRLVQIEVRIVEVTPASASQLSFDWLSGVQSTPPGPGGTSGHDSNLAVESSATGGPEGVEYFVYAGHRPEGALPILNKGFQSPFGLVKTMPELPTAGCVTFPEDAITTPQNHPGGDPVENVPPAAGGYDNVESVAHNFYTPGQANTLITSLQGMNGNEVFTAPTVHVYSGQSFFHMIDDIEPDLDDFTTSFRTRIEDVTMMPFGNFTGPTVDVEPTIDGGDVHIRMRIGTQMATFFFSTAFLVGGTPTDAEIPLHRRGTISVPIVVPSGQTVLLGGLKRTTSSSVEKGLPLIGDVPLIGSLFTRKHLNANNRLFVFITPTIIDQ